MNQILYKSEELLSQLDDAHTVIIDVRRAEEYHAGHIPKAVHIPEVFTYLSESHPEGLAHLEKTFEEIFSRAGVSRDKKVIFYEDGLNQCYGGSCRGYWLLTYLGHPGAAVLYGGLKEWREKGFPLVNDVTPVQPSLFSCTPIRKMMATREDVLHAIDDPGIRLLDDRDRDEWLGLSSSPYDPEFVPRKGRIPGARWIEWYDFMDASIAIPAFKTVEEIKSICAARRISPEDDIILYCFKGSRASNTYIALKLAGFEKVRVYFASWYEWARDFSLPIDAGTRSS